MKRKILKLIESGEFSNLQMCVMVGELNVADIAEIFERNDDKAALLRLFKLLSKDTAAEVFTYLSADSQEQLINSMTDKEITSIIADMSSDDAADMLEEMPANVVKRVLKNADSQTREQINQLLNYPEDSAGSIMTFEFVDLKKEMTVKQAFAKIKNTGLDKETIYSCYVVSQDRKLEGVVSVKTLLLAKPDDSLESLMKKNIIYASTFDDRETVAQTFKKYGLSTMPVVDKEARLVGIITIDDILDVIEQEQTEDVQKMAGIAPMEKTYLEASTISMWKNRIVWLAVLMVGGFFTGVMLQLFEDTLKASMILAYSIPLLMGIGGNAGAQTSALIIRGIALKQLEPKDSMKVWWKELRVSVIMGLCLAPLCFGQVLLINGSAYYLEALTVSLAAFVSLILSKTLGCLLPLAAQKLRLDPAIMSMPLITTIADICSVLIYLMLATLILGL